MKSLINFLTDSIYFILIIVLTSISFLATYALSPISFEESLFAKSQKSKNVLGEINSKEVLIKSIYQEHDYFEVNELSQPGSYVSQITLGPISSGSTSKELVEISNKSSNNNEISIKLNSAINDTKNLQVGIIAGDEKLTLTDGSLARNIYLPEESITNLKLFYESDYSINYPIELRLEIQIL